MPPQATSTQCNPIALGDHWSRQDCATWIAQRLAEQGITQPDYLSLARYDQLHAGGLASVRQLAQLVPVRTGQQVLDLGAGLGGAGRCLAAEFGAQVTCLDLTPLLVTTAQQLTALVGLTAQVTHHVADACATGLASGQFDGVWVQHLALHLPQPSQLWQEAARLLRPGGWLALHEWVQLSDAPILYPTPWSSNGQHSHLPRFAELQQQLHAAGFTLQTSLDLSQQAAQDYRKLLSRLHPQAETAVLPAGEAWPALENAALNLEQARLGCVMGVAYLNP